MDIRCNSNYYREFSKLFKENYHLFKNGTNSVQLTFDNEHDEPVIMAKMEDGSLREWTRGYKNIKSFLTNGYIKVIQLCPFSHFKNCRGEECQLYLVQNLTGDCVLKWSAILSFDRLK